MGIHIYVDLLAEHISPNEWTDIYNEIHSLLTAYPGGLMGFDHRSFLGEQMVVYTDSIVRQNPETKKPEICVVGDRSTKKTAECFVFPSEIHTKKRKKDRTSNTTEVFDILASWREEERGTYRLLGDKSQGEPYHRPILAAAMLIEARFPKAAMVSGDINRGEALWAQEWIESVLGVRIPIPVRLDPEALCQRLQQCVPQEQRVQAFDQLFHDDDLSTTEAIIRHFPRDQSEPWFLAELKQYTNPNVLGVQRLILDWLNATSDLDRLCELVCMDADGPKFSAESFVSHLGSCWLTIPPETRSFTKALVKPPGQTRTIASMLFDVFADMGGLGRKARIHIDESRVAHTLNKYFGVQSQALLTKLREESKGVEEQLIPAKEGLESLLKNREDTGSIDVDALVTATSVEQISKPMQRLLHAYAARITRLKENIDADPKLRTVLFTDPKQTRLLLVRMLKKNGPTLTQTALHHIVDEIDDETLNFLAVVMTDTDREIHLWTIRRAVLENPVIRQHVMNLYPCAPPEGNIKQARSRSAKKSGHPK